MTQLGKVFEQNRVEVGRRMRAALEARHPDAIAQQQMIERAVHTLEEGAEVAPSLFVSERSAGLVQFFVGEPVVERVLRPDRGHPPFLAGGGRNPTDEFSDQARYGSAAQPVRTVDIDLSIGGQQRKGNWAHGEPQRSCWT